jgi:hypothetical protein
VQNGKNTSDSVSGKSDKVEIWLQIIAQDRIWQNTSNSGKQHKHNSGSFNNTDTSVMPL